MLSRLPDLFRRAEKTKHSEEQSFEVEEKSLVHHASDVPPSDLPPAGPISVWQGFA
jgi:hypothetical protein